MCDTCIKSYTEASLIAGGKYDRPSNVSIVFFNFGLIQADLKHFKIAHTLRQFCLRCKTVNCLLQRCVSDDVHTYHFLEEEIKNEEIKSPHLCENLLNQILDKQNPGRVFVMLTCYSRMSKVWRENAEDFLDIKKAARLYSNKLEKKVPNFDCSDFLTKLYFWNRFYFFDWKDFLMEASKVALYSLLSLLF